MDLQSNYPQIGSSGTKPDDGGEWEPGDEYNAYHVTFLWNRLQNDFGEVDDFANSIDSDGDGVVDKADYANDADATTYKSNDLDSDGDGRVDTADHALNADELGGNQPSYYAVDSAFQSHADNTGNPHGVTLEQARSENNTLNGHLDIDGDIQISGNVDGVDISDFKSDYDSHFGNTSNPHGVTLEQARSENNTLNGDTEISNGNLSIQGERAATRPWVSSNFNNYSNTDARNAVNGSNVDIDGDADTVDGQHWSDIQNWVNSNADVPNADHANNAADADTLDGNHASAFADSGHSHDGRYYTQSQVDNNFNNYTDSDAQSALNGFNPRFGDHIGFSNDDNVISHEDGNSESGAHWSNKDAVVFQSDGNVSGVVVRAGYLEGTQGGEVSGNFTAGTLYESGDRIATRNWANSNFNNYSFSESHNDLSNVGSSDHHTRYSDSEARSAVTGTTLPGSLQLNASNAGSTAIDISSSNDDFNVWNISDGYGYRMFYRGSDSGNDNSLELFSENNDTRIWEILQNGRINFTGPLYDGGDRLATRSWANNNFNNYSFSESHDDLSNVSSSDHHTRYSDSEARSALESGGVNQIQFNNIEDVGTTQIGIDHSEGLLVDWGNGTAPVWDGYNVNAGNAINISNATGSSASPTISVSEGDISHDNISGVSSSDHHSRYSDSEARSAVDGSTLNVVSASNRIENATVATESDLPSSAPEGTQIYVQETGQLYVEDGT